MMLLQKMGLFKNIYHKIHKSSRYMVAMYRDSAKNKPLENLLQAFTDQKGKFNKKKLQTVCCPWILSTDDDQTYSAIYRRTSIADTSFS